MSLTVPRRRRRRRFDVCLQVRSVASCYRSVALFRVVEKELRKGFICFSWDGTALVAVPEYCRRQIVMDHVPVDLFSWLGHS